jgi:hypothetical protein
MLVIFQKHNRDFFAQLKLVFANLHPITLFLLVISLALTWIMCTWEVNHPDTLGYHAQTIQWIEKYKAVPGLVHLHVRYGYQGLWFVVSAFFDLSFAGIGTLTLINSVVVVWYLFFITQKINEGFYLSHLRSKGLTWLTLLIISFLVYTQIRLTITSASPDFIATLFTWLIFYLLLRKEAAQSAVHWSLLILLSFFSIALKLSALPMIMIAGYAAIQLIRLKKTRALVLSCLITIVIIFSFVTRNIITSGYVAFPSPFPDWANVDWKFGNEDTRIEKNYITAYARIPVAHEPAKIDEVIAMPMKKWLPLWWQNLGIAEKIVFVILLVSLLITIVRVMKIARSHLASKIALLTALAGLIFWFVNAPDPRFGFGFIIPFIAIVFTPSFTNAVANRISRKMMAVPVLLCTLLLSGYTAYRLLYFSSSRQFIKPIGIVKKASSSFQCGDILFYKPEDNQSCGDLPVPCFYNDSCGQIELRGSSVTDGFRAKK